MLQNTLGKLRVRPLKSMVALVIAVAKQSKDFLLLTMLIMMVIKPVAIKEVVTPFINNYTEMVGHKIWVFEWLVLIVIVVAKLMVAWFVRIRGRPFDLPLCGLDLGLNLLRMI